MPAGESGEICIFGPGVAVGYLGQPELTAQRFVANPLAGGPATTRGMYRTGDLGRIDAAGQLHYLGRADDQVKIRGFRVELGEIEGAIAAEPGVAAVAVTMRPLAGIEQLVAFVAAANGSAAAARVPAESARRASAQVHGARPFRVRCRTAAIDVRQGEPEGLGRFALEHRQSRTTTRKTPRTAERGGRGLVRGAAAAFPGQRLRGELDFFDDLGGHSLLVARLVSTLRADRRYATLSIQDVYRQPRLAADRRTDGATAAEHGDGSGVGRMPPRSPVPWTRRWLCGAVQAAVIPWLMLLHISSWLFPFFVYHYFTGDEGDSILLAAAYSVLAFLLAEVGLFPVAIAGKWLVAGRLKPGRYPLWGVTYFRWWLADRLCELPRVDLLSGTPLLCWFLRALGAKIGNDVIIDSVYLRSPDLLPIESGASVGTAVHIGNAGVEQGMLVLGPGASGPRGGGRFLRRLAERYVGGKQRPAGRPFRPAGRAERSRRRELGGIARAARRSADRTAAAAAPRRPPGAAGPVGVLRRRGHGGGGHVLHDRLSRVHPHRLDRCQLVEPV